MSTSLSLDRKGQTSRMEFIVALLAHSIFDDEMFAFTTDGYSVCWNKVNPDILVPLALELLAR